MNVRRGLFRLWVLWAAIWFVGVAAFTWDSVANPHLAYKEYVYLSANNKFHIVTEGSPYSDTTLTRFSGDHNTALYIENVVPASERQAIVDRFQADIASKRSAEIGPARLSALAGGLAFTTVPSLILLALGSALAWAFSGFRAPKPPPHGQR